MDKNLLSWSIYDAANSFIEASIGGLFLVQWLVLDKGYPDIWYGLTLALSTILILATSPFFGAWSDKTGRRMPFIKNLTILLIISTGLLAIIITSNLPDRSLVFLVLFVSLIIQYFYQLSLVFYNSLMEKLSKANKFGLVSGIGQAFNNLGWIAAVAILLPFSGGTITIFGTPGRPQAFFPAFAFFTLLSFPILFWFKEKETIRRKINIRNFKEIYDKTIRSFKGLVRNNRNAAVFLVAFSFISDAVLTLNVYFAIFIDQVYKVSDTEKFYILGIMSVTMIIGSYLLGKASDKYGSKIITLISCIDLILAFFVAGISSHPVVLYLLGIFGGLGYGAFYVTTRVLLIRVAPAAELGEYFGFYSTFQRFGSVVGPMLWGITTLLLRDYSVLKYRVAVLVMVILICIGTVMLFFVKEKRIIKTTS